MNKQTIMWTVLPNGITTEGGGGLRLRLSLLVSPRLETTEGGARPTLDPLFPDFLKWPELVETLKFQVLFEGRRAIEVSPNPEALSPELWPAIFKPDTYVKPHKNRDLSNLEVVSYPVRNVLGRVKEVHQEVAVESPVVLPRFEGDGQRPLRLHGLLRDVAPNRQRATQIRGQLATRLQAGRVRALRTPAYESPTSLSTPLEMRAARPAEAPLVPGVSPATVDFHQFREFHSSLVGKRAPLPTVAALVASVDFHQIVASLAQYPLLMRRLGLVIDLEVPLEAGLAGAQRVRVRPILPADPNKPHLSPWTNIVLDNQRFAARPRSANSDLADGMMRLDDTSRFEVGQIDVDGAAMKTLQLAEKAAVVASARLAPGALRPGAPPRGGGGTDTPAAAPPSPPESEEAALPSLRFGGLWVARTNRAPLLAAALARVMELQEAVEQDKPDEGSLYAEDLVRGYRVDVWDEQAKRRFSLCQRVGRYHFLKPDKTLTLEDEGWVSSATTEPPEQPNRLCVHEALFRWQGWSLVAPRPGGAVKNESGAVEATDKFGLEVSFKAKQQSLPRLRFGREYRLRARAVDLAGNGLTLEEADDTHATPPITYFRSEPVLAPVVIPRTPLADSPGESADTIVIRSRNDDPSKDKVPVDDRSQRHLAPPRTSQLMAEMHGMFDTDGGMKGDPATYKLIVDKDKKPAEFYDAGQLQLPYLPDPLAFGLMVRLRRLPSSDNPPPKPADGSPSGRVFRQPVARRFFFEEPKYEILQIPFGEDWPELKPVRLLLYEPKEATAKMEFEETQRLLRVPLPKAEAAEIWLSCYLKPTAIPRMQLWRWTVEGVAAPSVRKANLPAGQALQVHRQLHDPQQLLKWSGAVALPAAEVQTLQRLNTQAVQGRNWLLTPYRRLMLVHATQQPLGKPQFQHLAAVKAIGNTYATLEDDVKVSGKSSIRLDIVASWEEPLDPLAEPKPRVLKGEARVCEIPLDRDDATIPLGQRHEFGDTKYRAVTYKAIATTRYREYFQAPGKPQNLPMTRTSADKTVDVLSSARPAAPKILYVIPAFGWDKTDRPDGVTSKRQGGWLRVYLERP